MALGRRPILVTGSHRSGTTWVGKTIALSPSVTYIGEPFNDPPRIECRELAELKQEQIHAFGPDRLIDHCKGSMSADIEPAE